MNWWIKRRLQEELLDGNDLGGAPKLSPEEAEDADFLSGLFDDDEVEEAPAAEEAPVEELGEPAVPADVPVVEAPAIPTEVPAVAVPVTPVEVPAVPAAETVEGREVRKQEFLAGIEKEFALSEEEDRLMIENPSAVIPKLATRLYDRILTEASQMMAHQMSLIPQMMAQRTQEQAHSDGAEKRFLELNPALASIDAAERIELVTQFAPFILKQLPNGTVDDKMLALGRAIAAVKNINPTAPVAPKPQPVAPHKPTAPARAGVLPAAQGNKTNEEIFLEQFIMEE